jgi:predicted transcriptional regulator
MRPLSFEKMCEVLLALETPSTLDELARKCGFTPARAKEVLRQLEEMELIESFDGRFRLSENGKRFLQAFEEGDYTRMHAILLNFKLYREFFEILLSKSAVKIHEVCKELNINMLTLDILVRLLRKVNIKVVCNKEECYLERDSMEYYRFEKELLNAYFELVRTSKVPALHVSIPRLRELVKEKLKISDEAFDKLFREFVRNHVGRVVLSPAPLAVKKERGVKLGGRIEYYYVYILPEVVR